MANSLMILFVGGGFHLCIGVDFAINVILDIVKIVFSLKNVRRGPGDSGRLVKVAKIFNLVEVCCLFFIGVRSVLADYMLCRPTNT
jgi:hypothetical protein